MNANDIIEKCARVCDRYTLRNHEAAVKASRRASRLLEIDSAQRETAQIGSVKCEAAALEAAAIANEIRALKSSLPAETVSEAMVEDLMQTATEAYDNVYKAEYFVDGITDNHQTAMRAAVEAVHEADALAHADDGWRPIESAPKDGTGILVWIKGAKLPFTARWSVARNRWIDMQNDEIFRPSATHWRPLPAPPKDGRE